ncbi:MAG: glycerol-3-phosphate 1-O-acyltransferase PlsY [Clostridia bacterium]|nr:glycerol-3-phosphate 1-O-acyltransferase PlsY [Clostridia bacterium]
MYASKVWAWILSALIGYMFGSISGSITVSRFFYKDDIRNHGSGNAGTTNMLRTYGLKKAAMTIIIDFAKTLAAVAVGRLLLGDFAIVACGVGVTIGHAYPIYYNFKGGKAAACSAACMLALDWRIFLLEAVIFFGFAFSTRIVSISTIIVALSFPFVTWFFYRGVMGTALGTAYMFFAVYVCIFIIYLHRSNIKRLMNGTESRFGKKGK